MALLNLLAAFTSLFTATIFLAISALSVNRTILYAQAGEMNAGALFLGIAFLGFILALLFGIPNVRNRLTIRFSGLVGRVIYLPIMAFALFALFIVTLELKARGIVDPLENGFVTITLTVFTGLFLATFIYPGFAISTLRAAAAKGGPITMRHYAGHTKQSHAPVSAPNTLQWIAGHLSKIIIFVLALGWFYGSSFAKFVPNQEHLARIDENKTTLIAASALLIALLTLIAKQKPGKGMFRNRALQKPFVMLALGLFAFCAPTVLRTTAPALHSMATSTEPAELLVKVHAKGHLKRNYGCNQTASVVEIGGTRHPISICDIPVSLWSELEVGDTLLLSGTRTDFGVLYDNIRAPEPEDVQNGTNSTPSQEDTQG